MSFTITGYSTALFATWYFIDELGVLFDCGDGCAAGLLHKSRKVKHIFISHADRDHLTGLLQFSQLNNRSDYPQLFYPADSRSFPALNRFSAQFDPHMPPGLWNAIRENNPVLLSKDVQVTPIRNNHLPAPEGVTKSLGYLAERVKRKLKDEYLHLSGQEIGTLRKELGEEAVTYEVREKILAYSGDTPVENAHHWDGTDTLIHEATFLSAEITEDDPRFNKHSVLEDVIKMVAGIRINHLILGHFSPRYKDDEILAAIRQLKEKYKPACKIYAVLPGQVHRDILKEPVS